MRTARFLGAAFLYFVLGLTFLCALAAGVALSIDLAQFRYTVF